MGTLRHGMDHTNDDLTPDEGWWKAVLADEPLIEEPQLSFQPQTVLQKKIKKSSLSERPINWQQVEKTFSKDEIIEMNVDGFNRGGLLVSNEDMRGFVPVSHLVDCPPSASEIEKEQYFNRYLNRIVSVKIIECEPTSERIVFSERAALAKEGLRQRLLQELTEGDIISGVVTNITGFGVFVDLGGIEGLIHISELSWGRVQHPSDVLNLNDKIDTIVLQVDEKKGRIALSVKQMERNPWEMLKHKLVPGEVFEAKITAIEKYGVFACLKEGIEGLIHVSSITVPERYYKIEDFLSVKQPVKVSIININVEKRRLGLKLEEY